MKKQFLGHIIRADRETLGISQYELQRKVRDLSIEESDRLNDDQKKALLSSSDNALHFEGKYIYAPVSAKLISNIERGVARFVLKSELSLIARVLEQTPDKYEHYEINPMNLIDHGKVTVEEVTGDWFDRSIEFTPEYRQAGVSILSFFSEVVTSEYSDQDVRVGILQEGNKVTLRVETPDGKILKEIEKTLEKYGLVVMGSAPIESLSENRELIRDLKTKLEVTSLELRLRQENYLEQKKQFEERVISLEDQVKQLHCMIGSNLAHYNNLSEIIRSIVSNDKVERSLHKALDTIDKLAISEYSEESAKKFEASITEVERESPGLTKRLLTTIETIPASILANLLSPWVQSFLSSIPK